jgi:hypothetical protein
MVEGEETQSATVEGAASVASSGGAGVPAEPPPGVLVDRYRIERRLGAGGMGVVYAARDDHLGRTVAVKLVGPRVDPGSGQGRLAREAQAMATLSHPNIATVFDIGVSGDRLFVVMELVDGGTVADWLEQEPRSWREVVGVYLQAARGLAAAHAAGFVHRDFKPENVLLGKDGVARVSDFGVARLLDEAGRAAPGGGAPDQAHDARTVGVGTPGFIAPEILRDQRVDGRADQFSFCVALHAGLYGERPFTPLEGANRRVETLGARRRAPRWLAPRWLDRIVSRGLADDPGDRWPTIAALASAIERRLARRRRGLALGLAASMAVAITLYLTVRRSAPSAAPDWSPVVVGRETRDAPAALGVSPDGSSLVSVSATEAWIEPREGVGPRRRVALRFPGRAGLCRLSRASDQLVCSVAVSERSFEIWALDVATGRAARRVPPASAPTLIPGEQFDVDGQGRVLFAVDGGGAVWSVDPAGAARRLVTAEPGDKVVETMWSASGDRIALNIVSPSGDRVAVADRATGAVMVASRRRCAAIAWLSEGSLVCALRNMRRVVLVELVLSPDGGPAEERIRYSGPEYQALTGLYASSAGVLFGTSGVDRHLGLLDLDPPGDLRRIASGRISDVFAAGWTSSGSLIFGANVQGRLRVMRRRPDGRIEIVRAGPAAEVPLVVLGETIVFGRFPGGESTIPFIEPPLGRRYPDGELFRLGPDGTLDPLGRTRGFVTLYCAGGRGPPCLLSELAGDDVVSVDWDVATGARGRERARWSLTEYGGKSASLSPDGRTLARVQRFFGRGEISLLDLASGDRRQVAVPGAYFYFTGWLADGTLVAMTGTADGSGIARVRGADGYEMVALAVRPDEPSEAGDFQITPDGKTAAIMMTDTLATYWWVGHPTE